MKEFLRKNLALLVAFTLPILLVIGVALNVYLPSMLLSTKYNFVYATCDGAYYYTCNLDSRYSVVNGNIIANEATSTTNGLTKTANTNGANSTHLFLYDTLKNESREISLQEAQNLSVNSLLTSPDGVTVSDQYSRGPNLLFFGGGSSYGYYLSKGNTKTKLNIIGDRYGRSFRLIGWVLPGRN